MQKSNWRKEVLNEKLGPLAALTALGKGIGAAGEVVGGALSGAGAAAGTAKKAVQTVGKAISGREKTASQKRIIKTGGIKAARDRDGDGKLEKYNKTSGSYSEALLYDVVHDYIIAENFASDTEGANKVMLKLSDELMQEIYERTMTASEKRKDTMLKKKYDDSDMKKNMQAQYGKEEGKKVYFATIRKQAMNKEEVESVEEKIKYDKSGSSMDYFLGADPKKTEYYKKNAKKKTKKEEVEVVNEVSKKTLGSYVKKAATEIGTSAMKGDYKKMQKRHKGVLDASDKLAKEEVIPEAKYEAGASTYGKASIRNKRRFGTKGENPDPLTGKKITKDATRGELITKRREAHKEKRGVKTKVKSYHYPFELKKEEAEYIDLPLHVEIPDTDNKFKLGLMFRESLDIDKGMLFIFEEVGQHSFHMKNTRIPLDVAFVKEDGTIESIKELDPYTTLPVSSDGEVLFAIEANRGWFAENNVEVGDEIVLSEVKDKKGKGSGTKDACYHKVKSRYSVWPSAYASGALVKCRKVGAANWGNSKKESFSDWKSEFIWEGGDSSKKIEEAITPMQFVGAIDKNKVARGQRVPQMQRDIKGRDFDDPVKNQSLTKPDTQVTQPEDKAPVSQPSGDIKQLSPQKNITSMIQNRNSSIKKMMKNPVMSSHELEGENIIETPSRYDWRSELDDDVLYRLGEDWQKTNRQDKTDGMSQKAVNAYKRENPGSKLKTAVTAKPSSLKRGSKSAKRRKSFCSRMKGMKKRLTSAKTARDPDSRINKALRRWNC